MAESKTRPPQSQIPVKASGSRHAQSALPSTLPSPHFNFAPSSQHLSVSDSPTHPIPSSVVAPTATPSGITTFRSFRNLLPFGPTKLPNPATSPASSSKGSPFSNLGAIRRSMNGERSVSAPQLRPKKSQEVPHVLAIELSHTVDEPLIKPEDLRSGLGLYIKQPEPPPQSAPATSQRFQPRRVPSPPSPNPIAVSDLSTILEAETSGISKHVPNLDDSQEHHKGSSSGRQTVDGSPQTEVSSPPLSDQGFLLAPTSSHERQPSPSSQDTSALDLSTSKVSNEVLEALANDRQQGWLHGIVIDDTDTPPGSGPDDPNSSFNLGALDPDLAALLSPNNLKSSESSGLRSVDSLALYPTTPPMLDSNLGSPTASPYTPHPANGPSPSKPQSVFSNTSPVLTPRSVASQSSPVRRPAPLARSTSASAVPSPISVPSRPPSSQSRGLLPSPPIHTPPERTSDASDRPTSAGLAASRRKGYSQLNGTGEAPRRPATGDSDSRRPVLSRLMTPVRPALQLTPASGGSRSGLRGSNKPSPSAWDGDSISPSFTSMGGRPSLDSSADRFRNSSMVRQRDRSASVTERPATFYGTSGRPPTTEWLGPRTAKAFAAAGLIDVDKDVSPPPPSRPGSRFGTTRSQGDRDSRSQYAPSRMAFSEAGSGSSWGRRSGSISRPAMSEINGPLSESASTPRTTFSTGSTALTSVSSTSVQQHLQSEIQAIQDKHSLETGALLNALADSQRTTKVLRDENTELRERLHELESRLADAVGEIQRLQYQSTSYPSSAYSRSTYQRSTTSLHASNGMGVRRRPSALQTVTQPDMDDQADEDHQNSRHHASSSYNPSTRSSSESRREDLYVPPPTKRFSNSSSIFPVPPSTMSMLLHEDGLQPEAFGSTSRTPPSPTLTMSKLSSRHSQGSMYGHHRSTSASTAMTAGNISPTTANFSMLTGSPGSLSLRPEHERLLGDMPLLNLSADDYDIDGDDH
ncbi:hypothetical protein EIP91_010044 [Steccherinum ochraceum]|uniref:Uncharacterized protein n=1 Tax=Steccherinum ochraceum TaxID=92696 RepID=A0A4R0RA85_9APHY|nr:hypothetical protein EIP91_010044 [Steccherinum ochraceum]